MSAEKKSNTGILTVVGAKPEREIVIRFLRLPKVKKQLAERGIKHVIGRKRKAK